MYDIQQISQDKKKNREFIINIKLTILHDAMYGVEERDAYMLSNDSKRVTP